MLDTLYLKDVNLVQGLALPSDTFIYLCDNV
jgi:hypothetical protein